MNTPYRPSPHTPSNLPWREHRPSPKKPPKENRKRNYIEMWNKHSENCARWSEFAVRYMEKGFFHLGYHISRHPGWTILACVIFTGVFCSGIYKFHEEVDGLKLWVPQKSKAVTDQNWINEKFPGNNRFEKVIVTADNVLEPNVIQGMLIFHNKVTEIKKTNEYNWEDLCLSWGLTDSGDKRCASISILELWQFNETIINSLNSSEIQDAVSSATISPYSKIPFDVTKYLGGIKRDSGGKVISAHSSYMEWILYSNGTSIVTGEQVERAKGFEKEIVDLCEDEAKKIVDKKSVFKEFYYFTGRTRQDEGGGAIFGDLKLLFAGYALLFIFVFMVLGKFNCVEQRLYVALGGILSIIFSVGIAIGLASYAGWAYGPLHSILPFLILGLGVDDMFVIIQALDYLPEDLDEESVSVRMAHVMKHAGVSITVTSITDVVAFGIGATTDIPALASFCVYVCIAIIATYVLQCTMFVALVSLDERRWEAGRDACLCCYVHKRDYSPNECSQTSYLTKFFADYYTRAIEWLPAKIHIVLVTLILVAVNAYGVVFLKQDFNPDWFLPSDSYATTFLQATDKYYPLDGIPVTVYIGDVNYFENFTQLETLCRDVEADPYTSPGTTDCWFPVFKTWLKTADANITDGLLDSAKFPANSSSLYTLLGSFLQSADGTRFRSLIRFQSPTEITVSKIPLKQKTLEGSKEEIDAMESLRETTSKTGFPRDQAFPHSFLYTIFEGNKVIQNELYRNIGLAFLSVTVVTMLLLGNFLVCIMVLTCVVLTLVDVGGMLYFWGMTIDTVTSIQLILAVGLAIDYSAHVAFTFMTKLGNRNARTSKTLGRIGPAIFYGGFSTFLAFVMLAGSTSYVFRTFFKVFLGVTIFGLFHGLVFLPVLLSWIGPMPYLSAYDRITPGKTEDLGTAIYSDHIPSRNGRPAREDNARNYKGAMERDQMQIPRPAVTSVSGRFPESHYDSRNWRNDYPGSNDRHINGKPPTRNNIHQASRSFEGIYQYRY